MRWKDVEARVKNQMERMLDGVAIDIANVSGVFPAAAVFPLDEKDEQQVWRKAALDKMKRFADNIGDIQREVMSQGLLFKGAYGPLFTHRAERLADLQVRYSKFLDAKLVVLMMDLEDHLKSLDSDVAIAQKQVLFSSLYEQEAYRELQALLKIIVRGVESDQIKVKMT